MHNNKATKTVIHCKDGTIVCESHVVSFAPALALTNPQEFAGVLQRGECVWPLKALPQGHTLPESIVLDLVFVSGTVTINERNTNMAKITEYGRADIAKKVAEKTGMSQKGADQAVVAVLESLQELMVDGSKGCDGAKLTLRDFGIFETMRTAEKPGFNMQTNKKITIPASRRMKFTPAKSFKAAVKEVK